jgi:hypothetical protein
LVNVPGNGTGFIQSNLFWKDLWCFFGRDEKYSMVQVGNKVQFILDYDIKKRKFMATEIVFLNGLYKILISIFKFIFKKGHNLKS